MVSSIYIGLIILIYPCIGWIEAISISYFLFIMALLISLVEGAGQIPPGLGVANYLGDLGLLESSYYYY